MQIRKCIIFIFFILTIIFNSPNLYAGSKASFNLLCSDLNKNLLTPRQLAVYTAVMDSEFEMKEIDPNSSLIPAAALQQTSGARKSHGKAFLLSLLLPGLGERYAGSMTKSKIFMSTEVALWASYIYFYTYAGIREDDYRAYAAHYGGVALDGKESEYFINIGNYLDIDEYNAAMLRDRNLPEVYADADAYFWRWPGDKERVEYARLRVSADDAQQYSVMMIGAIFANHLISAVDAMWSAMRYNKRLAENGVDMHIKYGMDGGGQRVMLTAVKSF